MIPRLVIGSASALVLCAGASNAQFIITGAGCPGESGTIAHIQGSGFPTVGQSYTITVTGAPNTATLLGFGVVPIPPFSLAGVGLPGCTLDVLITTTVPNVTDATGVATYVAPPPGVAGITFYLQGYVADLGATTLGATTERLQTTTLPASTLSGGEIIVTEFLRDPSVILDEDGEWLELYNTTAAPIDLDGWYLADDDEDLHQIDAGGPLIVPAGGFAVLGIESDPLLSGLAVDYTYANFFLSNSTAATGDEIRVLDPVGFEVDRVNYSNPAGWPLSGGESTSLDPGSFDGASNDDPANWCTEATVYETVAGVNGGTPGAANSACTPPAGELGHVIITEVMQNPSALADNVGEYFEVYNTTASPIDLQGWTISDLGSDSHVIASSLIVPAGGYATLATSATPGFTPDYVYGTAWFLANADDEVVLTDDLGQKQDEILYDGGPLWPDPNGASMNFSAGAPQDATANNDPANWCTATLTVGLSTTDKGSPDAANETCP